MSREPKGIRAGTRIPVELPVQIRWKTQAGNEKVALGRTENMSGNGLFILAPVRLRQDTPIEFTVSLPPEITNRPMQLHCEGRVVRRHKSHAAEGLGVIIDDYRLSAIKDSEWPGPVTGRR